MPLPIPGSGILAVLPHPWQTCFYARGKVLASSSLAVKICREDLSRKAAKGAKPYRVSKTGFFAALRRCARSIFFPRGLRALFVQLLQPFNEPYQPIFALAGKAPYDVRPSRRSGEIGIRTRLKIWRPLRTCRFESDLRHHIAVIS